MAEAAIVVIWIRVAVQAELRIFVRLLVRVCLIPNIAPNPNYWVHALLGVALLKYDSMVSPVFASR